MEPTVARLRRLGPCETPATSDPAVQFARNLVTQDRPTAERISTALLQALDASVAAILEASRP